MSDATRLPEGEFRDPLANYEPRTFEDPLEEALAQKDVTEIGVHPFATISVNATVDEALHKLAGNDIACVMVEQNGKLVGIFSDRDVLDKVALEYDAVKDSPVCEVMTPDPVYVYETDSAAAALSVMAVSGYRHVPVVSLDEKILGIISPPRVTKFLREHSQR